MRLPREFLLLSDVTKLIKIGFYNDSLSTCKKFRKGV